MHRPGLVHFRTIHRHFRGQTSPNSAPGYLQRRGTHFQNCINFELTYLSQFLIVVELSGDHERGRCEVHFCRTNMMVILVSSVSTRKVLKIIPKSPISTARCARVVSSLDSKLDGGRPERFEENYHNPRESISGPGGEHAAETTCGRGKSRAFDGGARRKAGRREGPGRSHRGGMVVLRPRPRGRRR